MIEKKAKANSVPIMISSLIVGVILLVFLCANSHLIVSELFSVGINTRANSLFCQFQKVKFSKETTISNITGKSFVLLTIFYSGLENFTVYTNRSFDTIQEVGYTNWQNGGIYTILSREIPNGNYVIGSGEFDYFGRFNSRLMYRFLIVEEIHEPNALERIVMDYPHLAKMALVTLLTLAFSLIILPIMGLAWNFFEKVYSISS